MIQRLTTDEVANLDPQSIRDVTEAEFNELVSRTQGNPDAPDTITLPDGRIAERIKDAYSWLSLDSNRVSLNPLTDAAIDLADDERQLMMRHGSLPSFDRWVGPHPTKRLKDIAGGDDYMKLYSRNDTTRKGLAETVGSFWTDPGNLPVVGGVVDVYDALKFRNVHSSLAKGVPVSDEDLVWYNTFLEQRDREQGTTMAGKVAGVVHGSMVFAADMLVGKALFSAMLGRMAAGSGETAKAMTRLATRQAAIRSAAAAGGSMTKQGLAAARAGFANASAVAKGEMIWQGGIDAIKNVAEGYATKIGLPAWAITAAGKTAEVIADTESHALVTGLLVPDMQMRLFAERRIQDALAGGNETTAQAIGRSFWQANIEMASEFSGKYLGQLAGAALAKFPRVKATMAAAGIYDFLAGRYNTRGMQEAWALANSLGINGVVEEMGEERIAGFLHGLFGTEYGSKASLTTALKEAFAPGFEQLFIEGVAFSVLPMSAQIADHVMTGQTLKDRATAHMITRLFAPQEHQYAKTEEELRAEAMTFLDVVANLSEETKVEGGNKGIGWLENFFKRWERTPAEHALSQMGLRGLAVQMRTAYDRARKADATATAQRLQADSTAEAVTTAQDAVIGEVMDLFAGWQRVYRAGINNQEDRRAFEAAVEAGEIDMLTPQGETWDPVMNTAPTVYSVNAERAKGNSGRLADRFDLDITAHRKYAVQTHAIRSGNKSLINRSFQDLSEQERVVFKDLLGADSLEEAQEIHTIMHAIRSLRKGIRLSVGRVTFFAGTKDELVEAFPNYAEDIADMGVRQQVGVRNGVPVYRFRVNGENSSKEVVVTRGGGKAALYEELTENEMVNMGVTVFDESGARVLAEGELNGKLDAWVAGVEGRTDATPDEQLLARRLKQPQQRAEIVGKILAYGVIGVEQKGGISGRDRLYENAPDSLRQIVNESLGTKMDPQWWFTLTDRPHPKLAKSRPGVRSKQAGKGAVAGAEGGKAAETGEGASLSPEAVEGLIRDAVRNGLEEAEIEAEAGRLEAAGEMAAAKKYRTGVRKLRKLQVETRLRLKKVREMRENGRGHSLRMEARAAKQPAKAKDAEPLTLHPVADMTAYGGPKNARFISAKHMVLSLGLDWRGGREPSFQGQPRWNQQAYLQGLWSFLRAVGVRTPWEQRHDAAALWRAYDQEIGSSQQALSASIESVKQDWLGAVANMVDLMRTQDEARVRQDQPPAIEAAQYDLVNKIVDYALQLTDARTGREALARAMKRVSNAKAREAVGRIVKVARGMVNRAVRSRSKDVEANQRYREATSGIREDGAIGSHYVQDEGRSVDYEDGWQDRLEAAPWWLMNNTMQRTREEWARVPFGQRNYEAGESGYFYQNAYGVARLALFGPTAIQGDIRNREALAKRVNVNAVPFLVVRDSHNRYGVMRRLIQEHQPTLLKTLSQQTITDALAFEGDLTPLNPDGTFAAEPGSLEDSFNKVRVALLNVLAEELRDIEADVSEIVRERGMEESTEQVSQLPGTRMIGDVHLDEDADVTPMEAALAQAEVEGEQPAGAVTLPAWFNTAEFIAEVGQETESVQTAFDQAVASVRKFIDRSNKAQSDSAELIEEELDQVRRKLRKELKEQAAIVVAGLEAKEAGADRDTLNRLRGEYDAAARRIGRLKQRLAYLALNAESFEPAAAQARIAELDKEIKRLATLDTRSPRQEQLLEQMRADREGIAAELNNPTELSMYGTRLGVIGKRIYDAEPLVALIESERKTTTGVKWPVFLWEAKRRVQEIERRMATLEGISTDAVVLERMALVGELEVIKTQIAREAVRLEGQSRFDAVDGLPQTTAALVDKIQIVDMGGAFSGALVKKLGLPAESVNKDAIFNAKGAVQRLQQAAEAHGNARTDAERKASGAFLDGMFSKLKRALAQSDALIVIAGDPVTDMELFDITDRITDAASMGFVRMPDMVMDKKGFFSNQMGSTGMSSSEGAMRVLKIYPEAGMSAETIAGMVRAFVAFSKPVGVEKVRVGIFTILGSLEDTKRNRQFLASDAPFFFLQEVHDGIVSGLTEAGPMLEWLNRSRQLDVPMEEAASHDEMEDGSRVDVQGDQDAYQSGAWRRVRTMVDGSKLAPVPADQIQSAADYAAFRALRASLLESGEMVREGGERLADYYGRVEAEALRRLQEQRTPAKPKRTRKKKNAVQTGHSFVFDAGDDVFLYVNQDGEVESSIVTRGQHARAGGRVSHGMLFGSRCAGCDTAVIDTARMWCYWYGGMPADWQLESVNAHIERRFGVQKLKHVTWREGGWRGHSAAMSARQYPDHVPVRRVIDDWRVDMAPTNDTEKAAVRAAVDLALQFYERNGWQDVDVGLIHKTLQEYHDIVMGQSPEAVAEAYAREVEKLMAAPKVVNEQVNTLFRNSKLYRLILRAFQLEDRPVAEQAVAMAAIRQRMLYNPYNVFETIILHARTLEEGKQIAETLEIELKRAMDAAWHADAFGHSFDFDVGAERVVAPVMLGGSDGLHHVYVDGMRQFRALSEQVPHRMRKMAERLGLTPKATVEHRERVGRVLEAVGVMLDEGDRFGPESVVIRQREVLPDDGSGRRQFTVNVAGNDSAQEIVESWNRYAAAHDLPTAEALRDQLRGWFDEARREVNAWLETLSEEEYLKQVESYVNHHYRAATADERREFSRRFVERSRHAGQRVFPTYRDAAEISGLVPITMNALELYRMYTNSVYHIGFVKSFLTYAMGITDFEGVPTVGVIPVADGENVTEAVQKGLVNDEALKVLGRNLSGLLEGMMAGVEGFVPFREDQPIAAELERLYQAIRQRDPNLFVEVTSPYRSFARIFVAKGDSEWVMAKLLSRPWDRALGRTVTALNSWSKFMGLALSLFHAFAMMENLGASGGIARDNLMLPWNWRKAWKQLAAKHKDMHENPESYAEYSRVGLMFNRSDPNYDMTVVERQTEQMLQWAKDNAPWLQTPIKLMRGYQKKVNAFLWDYVQPTVKVMIFEQALANEMRYLESKGVPYDPALLREEIAQYANSGVGGIEWDRYVYASPRVRQALSWQWFAHDWTQASADIAGLTQLPFLRPLFKGGEHGPGMRHQQMTQYWPGMAFVTLFVVPNFIQFMLWSMSRPFVPDDDEMEPFTFLNEHGRKTHVDWTPYAQFFGASGGDTGKRRQYIRWGKQAWEVLEGWLGKPYTTFMNKQSAFVRAAFELITGESTGGWNLPFRDTGMLGWITTPDEGWWGSRSAYVVRKFVPMSVLSLIDGKPTTFFAPTSKGTTAGMATTAMAQVLTAYADDGIWSAVLDVPERVNRLEQLAPAILEGARLNGYDPEQVLSRARAEVFSKLAGRYWKAVLDNDVPELERISRALLRLDTKVKSVEASMRQRARQAGRALSETEQLAVDTYSRVLNASE